MLIVAGDSHTKALSHALQIADNPLAADISAKFGMAAVQMLMPGFAFLNEFHTVEDGQVRLKGTAAERLSSVLGTDGSLSKNDDNLFGFSLGFHASLMLRKEYWADFTILRAASEKYFVSEAVFKETVRHENRHIISFFDALLAADVKFFVICSPPIRQSMIDRQREFASAEELIAIKDGYNRAMMEMLDKAGIRYVTAVDGTTNGGVLLPEYDAKGADDVHHANPNYGLLMWRKLVETL